MIFTLLLKNLKIILRSPLTIVLLILAPIMLMFIVGVTYSGEALSGTKVGMIESEGNFFEYRDIEFQNYSSGSVESSRLNCIEDLKKSEVAMCIYFQPVKDNSGNLINANVYYYVDNMEVT